MLSDYFIDLLLEIIFINLRLKMNSGSLTEFNGGTTPSSDYNAQSGDRESKIMWGRHGNDSLIDFDPGVARPGQRQIDIFFGDFVDEEIYELLDLVGEDLERTPRDWKDRFILGDWQQPYYVDGRPLTFGLNQFALIADFRLRVFRLRTSRASP